MKHLGEGGKSESGDIRREARIRVRSITGFVDVQVARRKLVDGYDVIELAVSVERTLPEALRS